MKGKFRGGLSSWRMALAKPRFVVVLAMVLCAGTCVALILPSFFQWIAAKPGMMLRDPVLASFGPTDVSTVTFAVLYGALILGVASVVKQPWHLLQGLCAYVLMLLLRMITMSLLTLEPPPGIIPLIDPFTQAFYPGAEPFLKDLFFSGHTATLMLVTLLAEDRRVKWVVGACTAAIGGLVMLQHVHWTVDVLAAVPAAWCAWKLAEVLLRRLGLATASAGA